MNAALHAAREQASAAAAPFAAELERLDLLLEREILRLRARYELSLDEFRGLYVSDRQVDELLAQRSRTPLPEQLTAEAQARLAAIAAGEVTGSAPWMQLARRLELGRRERDLLLLGLAPELDPKYETLYAYLNNDVTRKWPTLELATRLFGETPFERTALRALLAPDARLLARGLLEPVGAARDLPRSQRGYRVIAPLADWLLGLPYSDERLSGVARLAAPVPAAGPLTAESAALVERAARWVACGDPLPVIACSAADPADAWIAAQQVFALARKPVLLLDLRAARRAPLAELIPAVQCLCSVLHAGVVAGPAEALLDHDQRPAEAVEIVRRLSAGVETLLLSGGAPAVRRLLPACENAGRSAVELHIPEPAAALRAELWQHALGERAPGADPAALADRFVLGADQIQRAARLAEDTGRLEGGGALAERLFDAARAVSAAGSDEVIRTVTTPFTWDDLIVPPTVRARLHDIVRAIELRPRVLDQWGFAARIGGARNAKIMLAGPSGTGKTMAAALIAKTLRLPLHKIQTAAVVSKYIGETEKNFDRAFDAARRANAILFVDEAEALLGRRSDTKDAHDHHVNAGVGYLLQKMEEDCLVILATNLRGNLDDAFSRRLHYVVDFPMPDVVSRERLWRGMFPPAAPLAGDVDFAFLARQFVLAGGDIRNIVLDAAYHAAQADRALGMREILQALARQYAKQGKLPSPSEFREYFELLSQGPHAGAAA
jgi:hypothetical protein